MLPHEWESFFVCIVDELDEILLVMKRVLDNGVKIFQHKTMYCDFSTKCYWVI